MNSIVNLQVLVRIPMKNLPRPHQAPLAPHTSIRINNFFVRSQQRLLFLPAPHSSQRIAQTTMLSGQMGSIQVIRKANMLGRRLYTAGRDVSSVVVVVIVVIVVIIVVVDGYVGVGSGQWTERARGCDSIPIPVPVGIGWVRAWARHESHNDPDMVFHLLVLIE